MFPKLRFRPFFIKSKFAFKNIGFFNKMTTVAVCQLTATNDKNENLNVVKKLFMQAAGNSAKMIFFPEASDYVGKDSKETVSLSETLEGNLMSEYKSLAKQHAIWLSIGGFHEKVESHNEPKIYNSHVVINDQGEIASIYRKLHLFDISLPERNINLRESSLVRRGEEIVQPIDTPIGKLGLSICYDLRFPELSTILRNKGAEILTYPSAFTTKTGEAHWETLLRSKAITNQCYVIAAAQYGVHNEKRTSYGQSLIIDPWGKILAQCKAYDGNVASDQCVAYAKIDLEYLNKIRREMPLFQHKRDDMYETLQIPAVSSACSDVYKFAHITVPPSTVFYSSKHCYAFTNIRCVVPGHVLVTTKRVARRLPDLSHEEASDFFQTVIKVQKALERHLNVNSSTICIQDGRDAGQTIPHVHCHVLPRKANDFAHNDDIYNELARHDRENSQTPIRSLEEQVEEANALKIHF